MMNDKTSLNQYFSEIDGKKLLSREEEQCLAKMMDAGRWRDENDLLSTNPNKLWDLSKDKETLRKAKLAREKLVRCNLRLVASVAKHYTSKGCELEDLIQEGNIGLIDGIDRFDYKKELKISTYCCWWIRQRIDRLISNHGRTVRVPVHVLTLSHKLSAMFQSYIKKNGCKPSIKEISSELECTEDMAKQALQVLTKNSIVTIDHSATSLDDDDEALHSIIKDEDAISPLDEISQQELIKSIRQIIKDLPERDEKILRLRFGITEDPTDHKSWPITEEEVQSLEKRKK